MKAYIYYERYDAAFFTPTTDYKYFSSRAEALKVFESRKQEICDRNDSDDENDLIVAKLTVARVEISPGKQNMLAFLNYHRSFVATLEPGEIEHMRFCLMKCEADWETPR
jgi:hypothetical protein